MRKLTPSEITVIAQAAHEVNRAYCMLLGDFTQQPWELASSETQASARAGVLGIASSDYTPEQAHESWMNRKVAQGWAWGPNKSESLKTHPCILPYADLPEEQRYKDVLYATTVKAMLDGAWRIPQ
jgi:hypothetical protein